MSHRPNPISCGWQGTLDVPVESRRRERPRPLQRWPVPRAYVNTCFHESAKVTFNVSLSLFPVLNEERCLGERLLPCQRRYSPE